jgi:hypothetical protein
MAEWSLSAASYIEHLNTPMGCFPFDRSTSRQGISLTNGQRPTVGLTPPRPVRSHHLLGHASPPAVAVIVPRFAAHSDIAGEGAAAASASQMMHTLIKTRAAGYLADDLF